MKQIMAYSAVLLSILMISNNALADRDIHCDPTISVKNTGSRAIKVLKFKYTDQSSNAFEENLTNKVLAPDKKKEWRHQRLHAGEGTHIGKVSLKIKRDNTGNGSAWGKAVWITWQVRPESEKCWDSTNYHFDVK